MRLATIDVGTNTTLLLVAETSGEGIHVLAERAEITRLGRGIGADGGLGRSGIERTLAVLAEYAAIAAAHGAAMLGALGLIAGLWAEKFDQMAAFQNFIIMPMTIAGSIKFIRVEISMPPVC